jgi:RHS repeat-associated protein
MHNNFCSRPFFRSHIILLIILSLTFQACISVAGASDVTKVNPTVTNFFKHRDNHQEFKQFQAALVQHTAEVQQLLPSLETSISSNKGKVQLESKLVELNVLREELEKSQLGGLSSSLGKKVEELSNRLTAVKGAKNSTAKKLAVQNIKANLQQFHAPKLRNTIKAPSYLRPRGLQINPTPKPQDPVLEDTENATETQNTDTSFQQNPTSHSTKTKDSLLSAVIKTLFDFLVPSALADDYVQPEILSGAVSCYADQDDYDANITQDMDLLQPELEVDLNLNPAAYEKITRLAAQLEYSPVRILEYVTNELEHEQYLGSVKGALGAITSGGANDTDHASLLVALLRASGIPARYVRGQIYFQDKQSHLDWWNVKDLAAASAAVGQSGIIPTTSRYTIDGLTAFSMEHVWVEACVPYGNYRGNGKSTESHRWVSMDPSFKEFNRIDGIEQNEAFDYAQFLSDRTKTLPHEEYKAQILEYIRSIDPNLTLNDVGTRWEQKELSLEFLPDTLPYAVRTFTDWSTDIATARSAILPEIWRAKVAITLASNPEFSVPMSDFAQHRITLSFEGATTADATSYLEFMDGTRVLDCSSSNLTVIPVFKKDGEIISDLGLSSLSICDGDDFRNIDMGLKVRVNNKTVSAKGGPSNNVEFDTISPLNVIAISAYPFNGSNTFFEERTTRLLDTLNSATKPSDNIDETIGEFLHIVLTKYMQYTTAAGSEIGTLLGTTGRSGHHIGVASTRADVEYVSDLPYAMHSNNFVVDVPGGLSKAVSIVGGGFNFDAMRLTGYTASHYESYVWQENALKDAVSTVSGLQIASSEGNEVESFTTGAGLSSFVTTCTDTPDTSSWAQTKALDSMVAAFRGAGFFNNYDESLKDFFVANNDYFTSYSTVAQINNALQADFDLCYPEPVILNIVNNNFPSGYANKVTISKAPVRYRGWIGPVYATESIKDDATYSTFGFPISSWSGGYTVPTADPTVYSGTSGSSSSSSSYSTGYDIPTSVSTTTPNYTTSSVATVNAAVGNGSSTYNTTAGDPVNMVTGNMYHEETDITLATRGLPLLFKRTYNSRNPENGPLGWGWTHSFNQTLEFVDITSDSKADTIVWTNGTGSEKFIELDETIATVGGILNLTVDKVFIPEGFYFTLERPHSSGAATEISLREKSGITYHFQAVSGNAGDIAKLTSITDRNGNVFFLSYTDDKLTTITDPDGRTVSFAYYDSTSLIHTITLDWDNTTYEYFYDAEDHLTAYRNPQDRENGIDTTSYLYYGDEDGPGLNHRLHKFSYANGYEMTFEYYVNGKVYRHTNAEEESLTFSYNDFRREATTLDEMGRLQRYIFDENGLPLEITDTLGGKEIYRYEDLNDPMLRTSVKNAMGYETLYNYDLDGNLVETTLPSGDTVTYSYYNDFGQPQLIKNAAGNYSLKRYDLSGNLTDTLIFKSGFGALIDPATFEPTLNAEHILSWTHKEYDGYGKLVESRRVKDFSDASSGPKTTLNYSDSTNGTEGVVPTSVSYYGDIDGDGIISLDEGLGTYQSEYDSQGRLIQGFNSALYPVEFQYDKAGKLLEGTDSLGGLRTYGYDAGGLISGQSLLANENGKIVLADNSTFAYDKANRRIVSADGSGAASYFEYDQAGNLKKATSPDGYTISFDYDDANRVISAYDEEGHTVQRTLDLIGRVKELTDPNDNVTLYSYYGPEQNGRVKRVTDAENRWTEFAYNSVGQVIKVTDSAGHETLSDYDALGRVVRVVSPVYTDSVLGDIRPVTTYEYNSLGHQVAVYGGYTNSVGDASADNLELQASYTYDDFGRVLKKFDALNKQWQISEYDNHGNALAATDPNGNVTTTTYGFGGVVLSKEITGSGGDDVQENITYNRNALGQPTWISSNNVNYTYDYDTAHRLTKVFDSRGGNFAEYDYSIGGMLNSISDNHGNTSSYLYDPVGRLTGIRTPDKKLISYVYDSGGRLVQKIFPNDLVTGYRYFKDNRVQSIVTKKGEAELLRHEYTYNESGDTQTATHTINGVAEERSYSYDGLGRLVKETDSLNTVDLETLAYDPFGNRRTKTVDGVTYFYSHNALHQIVEIRSGSETGPVVAGFTYDDNGNMTTKTYDGVTTTIDYDLMDRVVSVARDGLETETYRYDQGIRRIAKSVGSSTTNYHYSGPDIIGEYSADWTTLQALYGHGAAMDDPLVRIVAGSPAYYHGDGLGSIVGVSDSTGTLIATNRYDAWGNVTASTGTTAQYGYTGREPDATGLVYYRSRYYDPQIGRFTQPDPKGFIDGLNQYAYVMNSPVNYVDPWGMTASSYTSTGDSGGYISYIGQTISNSASLVGNAIYNGIVQPINTAINFMGSDDMVGFAQSIPSPMEIDNAVVGVFAGISKLSNASKGFSESAHSAANATRLSTQLAFEEAGILTRGGTGLTVEGISTAREIPVAGGRLTNPVVVEELTRRGGSITDWSKFTTQSVKLPSGQNSQIHFYQNIKTGEINLNVDFKVKGVVK